MAEMNPFLRSLLVGVGRVGAKAVASAADSALADADEFVDEAGRRVKRFRKGLADYLGVGKDSR